ncbi:MAG: MmcQ/YjbR family DNA-binding protein [Corynebacteriales bacterium]|nr:MmcQ/YjbR family DNA-binding protein [Mycobacteriales bacterium]
MTSEELRAACLKLPQTREEFPFPMSPGLSTFKVGKKVFAFTALQESPLAVTLKCDPAIAQQLRDTYPEIRPGFYKRLWNYVVVDGSLPTQLVLDMIEDSYDLVVDTLPAQQRDAIRRSAE